MTGLIDVHGHIVLEGSLGAAGQLAALNLGPMKMEQHGSESETGVLRESRTVNRSLCKQASD